jgi:hypothetical protein
MVRRCKTKQKAPWLTEWRSSARQRRFERPPKSKLRVSKISIDLLYSKRCNSSLTFKLIWIKDRDQFAGNDSGVTVWQR